MPNFQIRARIALCAALLGCAAAGLAAESSRTAEDWLAQGLERKAQGRGEEALECFQRAVEADPDLPEAQYWLGYMLYGLNESLEEARKHFNRFLELAGDDPAQADQAAKARNAVEQIEIEMARRAKAYLSDKKTAEQIADTLAAPTRAIAPYDGGRIAILVRFELDSAEIVPGEALTLDRVALSLTDPRIAGKTILVEGHTCSRGDSLHNLELSRKRAEAVRQALIRRGVDPARLKIQGFGEDRPIRPNDSEENQAANRRVEFVRID